MRTSRARFLASLCTAALVAAGAGTLRDASRSAFAGPAGGGSKNVEFATRVEPSPLGPDRKGTLVIVGTLARPKIRVHTSEGSYRVEPIAAPGVTYGPPSNVTPTTTFVDPEALEEPPEEVWFGSFETRVPFTVAADAALPVKVGAKVTLACCEEGVCFMPETIDAAGGMVEVRGAAGVASPPSPAPPPGGAAPPGVATHSLTFGNAAADVEVRWTPGRFTVTFTPKATYHLYPPGSQDGTPIRVSGVRAQGIEWQRPVYPVFLEEVIHEATEVSLGYTADEGTAEVRMIVEWGGCNDAGLCETPRPETLVVGATGLSRLTPASPPATPAPPQAGSGNALPTPPPADGLLFPVEKGTARASEKHDDGESKTSLLGLLGVFLTGVALAFTPCVLPLLPITVSVIAGGRADIPKARLTALLSAYVAGMSVTFGVMGLCAAFLGANLSAVFQSATAIWVIGGLFAVLSLGMFGIYEMQPPQWLQRMQGQAKGGNLLGALAFGALAALLSSPCTGPAILSLLVAVAQSGSPALGFALFATLGLGMGAVLFAAGSLNFFLRPGPWMVWVRYGFGILLVGAALYYVAHAELLTGAALLASGFVLALAIGLGIVRHLVRGQGEDLTKAARKGALIASVLVVLTGLVAWMERRPEGELSWVELNDPAQLVTQVADAAAQGRCTVVDVWATWCTNCKSIDRLIAAEPPLDAGFGRMRRLRINLTDSSRNEVNDRLRGALGMPANIQPFLVFLDAKGRIQRSLDLEGYEGRDKTGKALNDALDTLGVPKTPE